MTNKYVKDIVDEQDKGLTLAQLDCIRDFGEKVLRDSAPYYNETLKSLMCPAYWDTVMCWPDTPAGTVQIQQCPSYVAGFNATKNASRQCTETGLWFLSSSLNRSWTNYSNCYPSDIVTIDYNASKSDIDAFHLKSVPVVKVISQTGYIVSFSTLIVAFAIMLFIKKLHCARNILHMHLFASFIMRAFLVIVIRATFVDGLGLPSDLNYKNGSVYFNIYLESNNWLCKFMTSLFHYFVVANYSWILMEGLYLHNLIFRALFADSSNSIRWYVILGWGLPLVIVAFWVMAKLLADDTLCWRTLDNYSVFLIIAVPIFVSSLINLVLFMRVSMVLYSKLRSPISEDTRRYQKWAKSTLVLVPLFGFHNAVDLTLIYSMTTNKILEMIWLFCDQLFCSFQGFFVAVLYCFLNGEVKAEIQPHLYYFLTCLATNRCSKYLFPCRKKFLRSVVGRSSVCTTMSCSSLYTNGVLHRNSKCRLDSLPKSRGEYLPSPKAAFTSALQGEKSHICHPTTTTTRSNSKSHRRCSHDPHRHSQPIHFGTTETTLCIHHDVCRSEPEINEESRIMVSGNY